MAFCYKCKQPIAFKKLSSGKFCPTNVDGSDHWDLCKSIVNKPYTGPKTQFMGRTVDGVLVENSQHQLVMTKAAIDKRKQYGILPG